MFKRRQDGHLRTLPSIPTRGVGPDDASLLQGSEESWREAALWCATCSREGTELEVRVLGVGWTRLVQIGSALGAL